MKNGPYELVIAPDNYPGKRYRGRYCYEHHLVYWQNTGIVPNETECIHHINDSRRDNRLDNLELVSKGDHNRIHHPKAQTTILECTHCHRKFERLARDVRRKRKIGQTIFYCNRRCMGVVQGRINGKKPKKRSGVA